ncbi:MAG: OmpA family protein [Planctomycetota bacterium]
MTTFRLLRRTPSRVLALTLPLLAASCVSQQRFDEQEELSRYWQDSYTDLDAAYEQLTTEVRDLRERAAAAESGTQTASVPVDPEIDERMDRLDELARRLGRTPGDVTRIDVDGGYGFALADSVVFDSGSADLRKEGQDVLTELAHDIAQRPFDALWVRGHTDSVPMRLESTRQKYPFGNMQLSVVRALSVRQWLVDHGGLPSEKLFVAGFGPYLPVADNATPEGQQKNRRVEIVVLDAQSAEGAASQP